MQKGDQFEHYTPQFPLPVDIASMSRQDTVCQFCGVSYLIHNEIKALEMKCQKLEADLVHYAGIHSREADLEQKLQHERMKNSDFESTIHINTHQLNEMTRKCQLIEDQLDQSENAHKQTRASIHKYLSNLRQNLTQIRKEYFSLQETYSKSLENSKGSFQTLGNTLQKEIQSAMKKSTDHHRIEIEQYQQQLKETQQTLRNLQQSQLNSQEFHTTTQNDLEAARGEIQLHENEFSRLRQQLSQTEQIRLQLENDLGQTERHCQQLEQQLSLKDQSIKTNDQLLDQFREQLTVEKELRTKTNIELENLRTKYQQITNDYEQLTSAKKEFETNEFNTRRKTDELNRSRQAVLDRTREEYEKLLRKYTDLDEIYRELVTLRDEDQSQSKMLRVEFERLHEENIELIKQRETTHITHDVQIKKLHDSYAMKLREAEKWPDRLQSELTREREQHQIQINEIERRLRENYLAELNIERQKATDLLRKYEHESGYSTRQLRHELISTEKVTIEQRQYYTKQIEQLEKDKEHLKEELNQLRDVLKELHEQLKKQESINDNHDNSLQLKEDLVAKETSLFQAQSMIDQLRNQLEQTREEMNTLQETVHRECTEREQLKDALIDARQQLLAMKKNGVLNGRSLHSPPMAFEEIERRVPAPLPFTQRENRNKIPSFVQSEPLTRDSSLPGGDAADTTARALSSNQQIPQRGKALPPIIRSQQPRQRRNGHLLSSTKSDQLLENQRRIARFIKHIK